MEFRRLIPPAVLALALGVGSISPVAAQVGTSPGAALNNWTYNGLYQNGWSAERLMDNAEVYGVTGEEIGDIENIIIGQGGRIQGIVAEVGGFWDIGDTHVFVPWDQVQVSPTLDRVTIPVTQENVEDYTYAADFFLTRSDTQRTQVVNDDLDTSTRLWKATDLIDDYAYLANRRGYGYVNDLIFSADGMLQALVVNATPAYGAGFRAFPYYDGYGWSPGLANYNLPYADADIVNLARFDYDRLPNRLEMQNKAVASNTAPTGTRTDVTGAVPTQWTFRNVDRDQNLELTDREFSRVGGSIYGRWDANQNSRLEENEFYNGLYNVFDINRDGRVAQNEFNRGWRNWGLTNQQVSYGTFDANGDGVLDQNEFRSGFDRIGYYGRWDVDSDGLLAENEFSTGMYDIWDADSDGILAQNEFNDLAERKWF